jgi:hypothetical protein
MDKNRAAGPATRLRGVLIPTGWDDNGRPVELALADYAEQEYRIAPTADIMNLTGYLRREVDVTGRVTQDHKGRHILEVHTCEPVRRSV